MIATWRRHQSRKLTRIAEAAMDRGDWEQAQRFFTKALRLRPDRLELQTQLGHALKEMGRVEEAVRHYERAAVGDDDALYHLCVLHAERGEREKAGRFLTALLIRQPESIDGYRAMAAFGLETDLPSALKAKLRKKTENGLAKTVEHLKNLVTQAQILMGESLSAYDAIRATLVPNPPPHPVDLRFHIIVDARRCEPYHIRSTLLSLIGSDHQNWYASVIIDNPHFDHPVMSMVDVDNRFYVCASDKIAYDGASWCLLYTSAGISFDPQALAWFASMHGGGELHIATCDWDRKIPNWDALPSYSDPVLAGAFDLDLLLTSEMPPPLLAVSGAVRPYANVLDGEGRREALVSFAVKGLNVAHIPLPLVSVTRIPERADQAREKGEALPTWPVGWGEQSIAPAAVIGALAMTQRQGRPPLTCGIAPNEREDIRVIIPTRDCPDLLRDMVDSLREYADHSDHVRITVIDNRSKDATTGRLLTHLQHSGQADVMFHDGSFNWSHMNNLAVRASSESLLVFANNDMRMLSHGWDSRVRGQLSRGDVGVIGARLLYPDGSIQHAGMMLGLAEGSPVHIGVYGADGVASESAQFDQVRSVSCVTGAFMGITRRWFDTIGGFDAIRFPIAYNDVDLCLASRSSGKNILFDPGIELLHFESQTRGLNDNRAKIAWDQGELGLLFEKWGHFSIQDPYLSPLRSRPSLRGLTPVTTQRIQDHIDTATLWWRRSN